MGRKHNKNWGRPLTAEHKRKISEANKGQIPWITGIGHSEETKRKISRANKGRVRTEEWRRNLSNALKGRVSWNKGKKTGLVPKTAFKKGDVPWIKGKKHTKETLEKMSRIHKGQTPWIKGRRHTEESKQKMRVANLGDKSPNWQGGKSFEPYGTGFNGSLKKRVRVRDNYTCQICGCIKKFPQTHHIDYDKNNNSEENLVCLCNRCHGKTNFNRAAWKAYFNELLTGASKAAVGALVDSGLGEEKVEDPNE